MAPPGVRWAGPFPCGPPTATRTARDPRNGLGNRGGLGLASGSARRIGDRGRSARHSLPPLRLIMGGGQASKASSASESQVGSGRHAVLATTARRRRSSPSWLPRMGFAPEHRDAAAVPTGRSVPLAGRSETLPNSRQHRQGPSRCLLPAFPQSWPWLFCSPCAKGMAHGGCRSTEYRRASSPRLSDRGAPNATARMNVSNNRTPVRERKPLGAPGSLVGRGSRVARASPGAWSRPGSCRRENDRSRAQPVVMTPGS